MSIDDIKALIVEDESRTLKLKKTTGELKDGMHSACAFLNTYGGWLIYGIAPKSLKILGQEVTDSTQQEIAKAITGLEPAVDVKIHYVDVPERPGNKVIAMHFDGWVLGERQHTFHGCPYYKVESTTKVIPHEMYDGRIRAHKPQMYAWERITTDDVTFVVFGNNLLGHRNLFNHILRYNTIHYHTDSIAN
jgi:ATP-dependent DNA helicase RecG